MRLLERLDGERAFRRASAAVALLAVLHGLAYAPKIGEETGRFGRFGKSDTPTYVAAADAILHGRYSTPLRAGFLGLPQEFYEENPGVQLDITGLRIPDRIGDALERQAFRSPGYPLFLAAVGGATSDGLRWLAVVVQALLLGAATFLLSLTARRWWGPRIGLLGAALYAIDPYSKRYVSLLLTETAAGALAVLGAYCFTRAWQERSRAWWAAAGIAAGALTLVRPGFVLALPLLALAALLRRSPARERLAAAVACLAAAILLAGPWAGWVRSVTGRLTLQSYGEGYNLLLAAYGEGRGLQEGSIRGQPDFAHYLASAHADAPSAEEMASDPEAHPRYLAAADERYRDLAWDLYGKRLSNEPGQVLWEYAYRMWFLWTAHTDWYQPARLVDLLLAADWLALALAAVGGAIALRRRGPERGILVFLLAYTLVLATHHVEARFTIPLRGLYLSFAALALASLGDRLRLRRG